MVNKELNWILVSGATPKLEMLRSIALELGVENPIDQLRSPTEIDEKNHYRSSRYIYTDKARQTWDAARDLIGNDLGIVSDVHPKTKKHGEHQFLHSLTKYPKLAPDIELKDLPLELRKTLLARYILDNFEMYGDHDPVDVRQSCGVVPFFSTAMIGLIVQKSNIRYPTNPVQSIQAARELLDYTRTASLDTSNKSNNNFLQTSMNSAGGILQPEMLAWYLRENKTKSVIVDSSTDDPIEEIARLGSGFTQIIVAEIARLSNRYTHIRPTQTVRDLLVKTTIPYLPKKSFEVIWSTGDNRCVAIPI